MRILEGVSILGLGRSKVLKKAGGTPSCLFFRDRLSKQTTGNGHVTSLLSRLLVNLLRSEITAFREFVFSCT